MISEFDKLDEQLFLNERPKKRLLLILLAFCIVFCCFVTGVVYAYHIRFGEHIPLVNKSIPWLKPIGSVKEKPLTLKEKIPDNMEIYNRLTSNDNNTAKKIEKILLFDFKKSKKISNVLDNKKKHKIESIVQFANKNPILISTDLSTQEKKPVSLTNNNKITINQHLEKIHDKKHQIVWQVQMGVTHDKKQAIILFQKWQKKYPSLFKNKKLIFESIKRPSGVIYRMRIVPFVNYDATKEFCIKVSNIYLPCFLPKN